jgi:hypothetical protein
MRYSAIALAFALAFGLAQVASPAAQAAPAAPISKTEARALPTQVLKRRVLAQVADLLVEGPRPTGTPHRPLSDLWFHTKPVATHIDGVCRSDLMVIEFQSDLPKGDDGDADTPVQASGLSVTSFFYVAAKGEKVRCDRLDLSDPRFLRVADPLRARDGVSLLRRVATGAAQAKPPFAYHCGQVADCLTVLALLKPATFAAIEDCTHDEDREARKACTTFTGDDLAVTVMHRDNGDAIEILSVSVREVITIADLRAD